MPATATQPAIQNERKTVDNPTFVRINTEAARQGKGIKWISEQLGLSEGYINQKRTALRNAGVALPNLTRGTAANKLDLKALNEIVAKETDMSLEEIQAMSDKLVKEAADRRANGESEG